MPGMARSNSCGCWLGGREHPAPQAFCAHLRGCVWRVVAYLNTEPRIPVAALDADVLKRRVGNIEPVPGTRDSNALIVDTGDHRRQLWVKPQYSSYRSAWERLHVHIPADMEVDHVFNRARAQVLGFGYVRLLLCVKHVNQAHGAFIEQRQTAVASRVLHLHPRDELLFASNWTIAKMANVAIDRKQPMYDQPAALAWLYENQLI